MNHGFPEGAAFVFGGSGDIGGSICEAFARHGQPVALTYNRNREQAETVAGTLTAGASIHQVDAADSASIESALKAASEQFGGLHSVIYAGGPRFKPQYFGRMDDDTWLEWFNNDAMAAIRLARAALPYLRSSRGSFTAISSYQAIRVEIQGAASAVSKAAVDRMIAVLAKEEGRYGVRANAVRCGWIGGKRTTALMEKFGIQEEKSRQIALRRLGRPDEVGETVVFLSSGRAGYLTGQAITLDGGETL